MTSRWPESSGKSIVSHFLSAQAQVHHSLLSQSFSRRPTADKEPEELWARDWVTLRETKNRGALETRMGGVSLCHFMSLPSFILIPYFPSCVVTWMSNNCSKVLGRKQNARCAQKQSKDPRPCHACILSVCNVSINWQASLEDNCKQQSTVRFVWLAFKFLKETRSTGYPLLFISTDWWISSFLKMAVKRLRDAAAVKRTTL